MLVHVHTLYISLAMAGVEDCPLAMVLVLMGAVLLVVLVWIYCKTGTKLVVPVDEQDEGELVIAITTSATGYPTEDDEDDVGKLV